MVGQYETFYSVGLAGINGPDQEKLREGMEGLGISAEVLDESELEFMLSRNIVNQNLIGIVTSPEQSGAISDLKASGKHGFFVVEHKGGANGTLERLSASVIRSLSARAAALSRNFAAVSRDLSEVRALFDSTERAHAELDRYLHRHGLIRPQTLFLVPAGRHSVRLARETDLRQPLPHDPYGLCAVALNLATPVGQGSGLEVDLLLGEDRAHRWSLHGPLEKGRLLLSLPTALREEYRAPSLAIRLMPDSRNVVELAQAEQRVTSKWSPSIDGRGLEFPLALALDFAPPGTSIAARMGAAGQTSAGDSELPAAVVLDSWSNVSYQAEEVRHEWQLVVAEDGTLQAHPLLGAMTVVYLNTLDLAGMRRLRADIRLAHEAAPRIGFALALIPKDKPRRINLKDTNLSWAAKRSPWFELSGKADSRAVIEWEPEEGVGMMVALVTACLDRKADFAWARWGPIVLER